jgi:hypothetical protein
MTAKDFYRILGRVRGVTWTLRNMPVEKFGKPNYKTFIDGERHQFMYSPLSAVAAAVRRQYVGPSHKDLNSILRLDRGTYQRIQEATYQQNGFSPAVRRKLLEACRLPWHGPTS